MLFERISVKNLLRKFASKELTCTQFMEQVIERSEQTKHLNHLTYQNPSEMLEDAIVADKNYKSGVARVLEGIPIAVKDNIDTIEAPTTGGSAAFLNHKPKYDASLW
mmetsp:Transcript_46100/g.33894  ORF Transcript_46100/g.33894 Transcript_46100/m.33894 type:complete len:107 (-) Transcript_46100:508-828(-)